MLASKGKDDTGMWRKVSRSLDTIIEVTKSVNENLKLQSSDSERNVVNLSKEIITW